VELDIRSVVDVKRRIAASNKMEVTTLSKGIAIYLVSTTVLYPKTMAATNGKFARSISRY
jgi:hypothetical protein